MAWCSDIATGAAANVVPSLLKKVVQEVKLVISLPQAISDMEGEVQRLNDLTHEINVELARVQLNPKSIVKGWLDKASEAIASSGSIRGDYEQQKNCLAWCPNCVCRYRIGRRIRDWKASVAELHSERQSDFPPSGEYGDPTPRTQVPVQNPESGSGLVVDTRRSEQTALVERLLSDEGSSIRRIGIQGMGGVGKTSMLDAINDSQRVRDAFDLIIKVTVSRNHIRDIQNSVADRLKLKDFKENSNFEERKEMLRSSLKNKKYLILLDDMWAEDMWTSDQLQELGVSLNDTAFKIFLTTRDKRVCARMDVEKTITVEPLLEDDGWQLFRSRAFQNRDGNVAHEIEEVAREFAKECKGLPLAIIVLAAAMKDHTELYEWEVALDQMKNVPDRFDDLHAGVDKQLFQRLKWSYDVLPDYLKSGFLYFAAYPEDREIEVEEVIDMWISEGLVIGSRNSYLHDIGHQYIKQLADRCLIEVVTNDAVGRICYVKIHDVLRDLAIRIAEKEHRCHFKAGLGLSHFPSEEEPFLEGCARMSLMRNALHSLPTTFACSSLSVLLLRENPGIKEVPESFLLQLPSLRVLNLSRTGITSLPPSIGNLQYLAYLNLSGCNDLCELPESIGDLKELQFLNLNQCGRLRCLPESIHELKRLRALLISNCRSLEHLPRGVSQLVSLERVLMHGSSVGLRFEEEANAEIKYACLKDLHSLSHLRVFTADIEGPAKEGVMGNWSKMRHLTLDFDGQDYLPQDMKAMEDLECLTLWNCNGEILPSWFIQFRKLANLFLGQCEQLKELPAELPCLRELNIYQCPKLGELELGLGFPKLQQVRLDDLESLKCVGAVGAASGSGRLGEVASTLPPMLKFLRVSGCGELKRLRGDWDKLTHLEEIRGDREWWDAVECDDPNIKTSLESKYRGKG